MIRLPNTVPIPAPDPATPTVAAPAPMNLAAVSMSLDTALVWKPRARLSTEESQAGNKACAVGTGDTPGTQRVKELTVDLTVMRTGKGGWGGKGS